MLLDAYGFEAGPEIERQLLANADIILEDQNPMKNIYRTVVLSLAALSLVGITPSWAAEAVIYRFAGGNDGRHPFGGLVADASGALYGTANAGGQYGYGTVFKLTPSASGQTWTETTLYSFCRLSSCDDGSYPEAGLVFDNQGALYGTTSEGGDYGYGMVFQLTPPAVSGGPWTETVLYSFCKLFECFDGSYPQSGVIFDNHGSLYGTTEGAGGILGQGTVFELTPNPGHASWLRQTLYVFCSVGFYCTDGKYPVGGLVFGKDGALYGTTIQGGSSGGTTDCSPPYELLGCGTVFQLRPPTNSHGWTETVIHNFTNGAGKGRNGGAFPSTRLIFGKDGALYGTATGGASFSSAVSDGSAFKMTPPATSGAAWAFHNLYDFGYTDFCLNCVDGDSEFPNGLILGADGSTLYGTAQATVPTTTSPPQGTVFELSDSHSSYVETILHYFPTSDLDGTAPLAALIFGKDGALYGTTSTGGGTGCFDGKGCGTVFKITNFSGSRSVRPRFPR